MQSRHDLLDGYITLQASSKLVSSSDTLKSESTIWRQTSLLLLDAMQAYPEPCWNFIWNLPPFGRFLLSPVSCPILFPSWAGVLWCLRSSSFSFHFNKNRSSKNIRTTNKQKPNAGSWWVPKPNPTCGPTLPGFTAIWAHSRAPEYLDVHGLCLWSCSPGASTARCMDRCVDPANDSRQLDHSYATILQLTEIEIASCLHGFLHF